MRFVIGSVLGLTIALVFLDRDPGAHWARLVSSVTQFVAMQRVSVAQPLSPDPAIEPVSRQRIPDVADSAPSDPEVTEVSQTVLKVPPTEIALPEVSAPEVNVVVPNEALALAHQRAWSIFRSETSAAGFAAQLTRQLNRQFEVVKLSPGKYEVRFFYASHPEREVVLQAIAEMTGFYPGEEHRDLVL